MYPARYRSFARTRFSQKHDRDPSFRDRTQHRIERPRLRADPIDEQPPACLPVLTGKRAAWVRLVDQFWHIPLSIAGNFRKDSVKRLLLQGDSFPIQHDPCQLFPAAFIPADAHSKLPIIIRLEPRPAPGSHLPGPDSLPSITEKQCPHFPIGRPFTRRIPILSRLGSTIWITHSREENVSNLLPTLLANASHTILHKWPNREEFSNR